MMAGAAPMRLEAILLDSTKAGLVWPVVIMNILKEPLLHFMLVGAILFGAYAWINRAAENSDAGRAQQVHIGVGDVEWLAENWTSQWRRPPTQEELRSLIMDYLNEQLLAREARALGLEDNDVIVRRRLAQKLTFLIEDTLRRAEPSEAELQQFYEAYAQRFRSDARISFKHIFFSPQRRVNAWSDATDALSLLENGSPLAIGELGDRSLVETEFFEQTQQSISNAFGPNFARTVFSLKPAAWGGPIESGYGLHLVRVSTLQEAQLRPFSDVRARVVEEWRRGQETLAKERYLAELGKKYGLVVDDAIKPLIASTATAKAESP
jgi:PPIC-type PPIASE domain